MKKNRITGTNKKRWFNVVVKNCFRAIKLFIGIIIIYLVFAVILSAIPVNRNENAKGNIEIFLLSNGVHTDIVVPYQCYLKDWSSEVKFQHFRSLDTTYQYLAFGWGDRAFYLETPTWADLKARTAFNAVFGLGPSAIHATFFKNLMEDENCIKLYLSEEQYLKLVSYIEATFELDASGITKQISANGLYGPTNAFYEAKGRYNLFKTCNTWTNKALKVCGQKACLWTPFDKGIFWHYR